MVDYAIALTGGIATGKSTVSNLLKLEGFSVIDADTIAHKVLDQEAGAIAKMFGAEFVKDKKVDRKALGGLIFSDKEAKRALEELLHPKIKESIFTEAKRLEKFKVPFFIDIPLFFETKNYAISPVVVVYAPKDMQIERLIKREGLSKEEALKRIKAQLPIEKKLELADFVVDNSKDLKHLQSEVEHLVIWVKERYGVS